MADDRQAVVQQCLSEYTQHKTELEPMLSAYYDKMEETIASFDNMFLDAHIVDSSINANYQNLKEVLQQFKNSVYSSQRKAYLSLEKLHNTYTPIINEISQTQAVRIQELEKQLNESNGRVAVLEEQLKSLQESRPDNLP